MKTNLFLRYQHPATYGISYQSATFWQLYLHMCMKICTFVALNANLMPKQNTALLLSRYIWLIDTIYSAGSISREEIDRRWCRSLLSEGEMAIPERTFHRYKDAIQELFQINIAFSKSRGYYIENTTDFDINEYFRSFYGVSSLSNAQPEIVQLRVDASQVKFFRTLPLHHSQEEIETTDAYSVFQYYLIPTFELTKEILSNGPYVEVLLPLSLREEIQSKAKKMAEIYK